VQHVVKRFGTGHVFGESRVLWPWCIPAQASSDHDVRIKIEQVKVRI